MSGDFDYPTYVGHDNVVIPRAEYEALMAAALALPNLVGGYRYSLIEPNPPALDAGRKALAALRAASILEGE